MSYTFDAEAGTVTKTVVPARKSVNTEALAETVAKSVVAYVERRLAPLLARIEELESRPGAKGFFYRGVWTYGELYGEGDFVTHDGGLWHANAATRTTRPGQSDVWQLAVKSGRR